MHAELVGDEYMYSGEPGGVWLMYTVQGQGLAPLALGSARPDPTRARVRARC